MKLKRLLNKVTLKTRCLSGFFSALFYKNFKIYFSLSVSFFGKLNEDTFIKKEIPMETYRLKIRPYQMTDLESAVIIFSDTEMMTYYPAPFSKQKTMEWLECSIEHYQRNGMGLWAVCLKETGQLIGDCGIVQQVIDGEQKYELGYHIAREYWRKGYGSEATEFMLGYGKSTLGLQELVSIIDPMNTASLKLAEKNHFHKLKNTVIFDKEHVIYQKFL